MEREIQAKHREEHVRDSQYFCCKMYVQIAVWRTHKIGCNYK